MNGSVIHKRTEINYLGDIIMMPGRVLVRRKAPEKVTEGGIILPDATKKILNEGTVLRVGQPIEEDWTENGPKITGGEHILFAPMGGVEVEIGGEKLLVISIVDIFMIMVPC